MPTPRNFYTSSSCGVCGKGALEAVAVEAPHVGSELRMTAALLSALPERLRSAQAAFAATGGLHATGLFSADGDLLCVREDVGRHNAMDKVIGWAFADGRLPLADAILCVSGRLSFELVQKAAVAGCPVLVAVGAPSSLAVELAADRGSHSVRFRPRRARQRLHRAVARQGLTGVLLVGGASRRFGSPKALALLDGETLADRAWRTLGEGATNGLRSARRRTGSSCRSRWSTTKRTSARPSPASSPACARRSTMSASSCLSTARSSRRSRCGNSPSARRRIRRAAPLPGAYPRPLLCELERRLERGDYSLRELEASVVELDERELANVNTQTDLLRVQKL
jgi:molybdopterin-guanine dinucleotide biosynthesis protein A